MLCAWYDTGMPRVEESVLQWIKPCLKGHRVHLLMNLTVCKKISIYHATYLTIHPDGYITNGNGTKVLSGTL